MSTNRYIDKLKARLAKEADQRMQLQALLDDQVARNRALLAERDAAQKDAERYQLLASTLLADCSGAQMTTQEGALYRALNEIEHVNSTAEIDAIFDAALQGEQP